MCLPALLQSYVDVENGRFVTDESMNVVVHERKWLQLAMPAPYWLLAKETCRPDSVRTVIIISFYEPPHPSCGLSYMKYHFLKCQNEVHNLVFLVYFHLLTKISEKGRVFLVDMWCTVSVCIFLAVYYVLLCWYMTMLSSLFVYLLDVTEEEFAKA